MGLLTQLLHRLAVFVDRRRGALLVFLAVALFAATLSGLVALRPPFLTPAIQTVEGWLEGILAGPLRTAKRLQSPAPARERLVALELEVARLRETQRENRRLRDMLGYRDLDAFTLIPARIVGLDLDPVHGLGWIDKGTEDGIDEGLAVVSSGGLVGVVEQVGGSRSRVRLLRNRNAAVGVRDTRSRALGVVEWNPGRAVLELNFVPRQADVAVGDTLISSGLGGYVDAGIPVGRVASLDSERLNMLLEIRVEPFASFHTLEEVFVVRSDSLSTGDRP